MPRDCCIRRFERLKKEDPDMPVFTLLAKDLLAVPTVKKWLEEARKKGVNPFKIEVVEAHLHDLERWAKDNPERMQLPD